MKEPLLSIVVPTYNRYEYLKGCISTLIKVQSDNIEFIIQDNTRNNDEIVEFIRSITDSRIKYYHVAEHMSVSENCNMGIIHASGRYVCMLGDDDTISSKIIKAAEFCEEHRVDGCCFPFPGFNWPDMTFENGHKKEKNFFARDLADGGVHIIDAKKELKKALREGGTILETMPKLYHGLVSKNCLDRVYEKTHTYFPGPSPDQANATCVCLESQKTIYLSDYLIISGYGRKSARGEGNRNQHFGKITDKPWLPKNIMEEWDPEIPPIFSGETIFAQSMSQALKTLGENDLLKELNYGYLYAMFIYHHRNATKEFLKFCIKKPSRIIKTVIGAIQRAKIRPELMKNPRPYYHENNSIETLENAQFFTEELCKTVPEYHFL